MSLARSALAALVAVCLRVPARVATLARVARLVGVWAAIEGRSLLPQFCYAIRANRLTVDRHRRSVEDPDVAADAPEIDLDVAIALWQFETDRLAGLSAKAGVVLAADAIVATGIATLVGSTGLTRLLCVASLIYLSSALGSGLSAQLPRARRVVRPEQAADGAAGRMMIEATRANVPEGIMVQNFVFASLHDTYASAFLFLAALLARLFT